MLYVVFSFFVFVPVFFLNYVFLVLESKPPGKVPYHLSDEQIADLQPKIIATSLLPGLGLVDGKVPSYQIISVRRNPWNQPPMVLFTVATPQELTKPVKLVE